MKRTAGTVPLILLLLTQRRGDGQAGDGARKGDAGRGGTEAFETAKRLGNEAGGWACKGEVMLGVERYRSSQAPPLESRTALSSAFLPASPSPHHPRLASSLLCLNAWPLTGRPGN